MTDVSVMLLSQVEKRGKSAQSIPSYLNIPRQAQRPQGLHTKVLRLLIRHLMHSKVSFMYLNSHLHVHKA